MAMGNTLIFGGLPRAAIQFRLAGGIETINARAPVSPGDFFVEGNVVAQSERKHDRTRIIVSLA